MNNEVIAPKEYADAKDNSIDSVEKMAELLEEHRVKVIPLFVSNETPVEKVEDAFQDVSIVCLRNFSTIRTYSFRNYLCRAVRRKLIDYYRSETAVESVKHVFFDGNKFATFQDSRQLLIEEIVESRENQAIVRTTIEEMSEETREILRLKYTAPLSNKEIAKKLSANHKTVISRMISAEKRFGQKLQEKYPDHFTT